MKISVVVFLSLFCYNAQAQNDSMLDYRTYFRISKEANYNLFKGAGNQAVIKLSPLMTEYRNFPFDYLKVGRYLLGENAIDSSIVFFELAVLSGYDLNSILDNITNPEQKKVIAARLIDCQTLFDKTKDTTYISFLDSLAHVDQQVRTENSGLSDSLRIKKIHAVDSLNVLTLRKYIEHNGWPSYKRVGYRFTSVAFIVLLHGLRCYTFDSSEFVYFRSLMESEIIHGNFDPNSYANLIDQYHAWILKKPQIYGSMADPNNVLYPIEDIVEVNKNRNLIGLNSLEHYLELKGYQLK